MPEPTRTAAAAGSLLAQEASAVTYNWDTDTLFITSDGGTSIVQVSKTGELIDSMTLAPGGSPQGTEFYDPEGITYIGNGQFVMSEERDRQVVQFTYEAGTTLTARDTRPSNSARSSATKGSKDSPTIRSTGGFIIVKETQPQGIFQTTIDFVPARRPTAHRRPRTPRTCSTRRCWACRFRRRVRALEPDEPGRVPAPTTC